MWKKRGKDVNGKSERKQLEIDFIANQGSRRYYIQSAFAMPDEEKKKQEKMSLLQIRDSFKKNYCSKRCSECNEG